MPELRPLTSITFPALGEDDLHAISVVLIFQQSIKARAYTQNIILSPRNSCCFPRVCALLVWQFMNCLRMQEKALIVSVLLRVSRTPPKVESRCLVTWRTVIYRKMSPVWILALQASFMGFLRAFQLILSARTLLHVIAHRWNRHMSFYAPSVVISSEPVGLEFELSDSFIRPGERFLCRRLLRFLSSGKRYRQCPEDGGSKFRRNVSTWRHIPDDSPLPSHRHEDLQSHLDALLIVFPVHISFQIINAVVT